MPTPARLRWTLVSAFVVLASAWSAHAPRAAQQPPANEFEVVAAAAWRAFSNRDFDAAAIEYQRLLDLGRQARNELWEGRGWLGLGSIAADRLQYGDARETLRRARNLLESAGTPADIGRLYVTLGIVEGASGTRADARVHFARAVAAFDEAGDARGSVHARYQDLRATDNSPDNDEPLSVLAADARALGNRSIESAVLHLLGDRLFNRGHFDRAIVALDAAAAALAGDVDPIRLGTIYNSLGRLYRAHGQLESALEYQRAALAVHEKQNSAYAHIQSLNAVAATYHMLGDLVRARDYYEQALDRAALGATPSILAFLRASYGDLLVSSGDVARGRALLAQSVGEAAPAYRTMRRMQLARADLLLGRLDRAADEIETAISHCAETTHVDCARARLQRATIALARGDEAAALDDHQAVLRTIEEQHASLVPADFLKQGFAGLWTPVYSLAVRLQLRQGRIADALETAELGRSRALLDLLASREPRTRDDVDRSVPVAWSVSTAMRRSDAVARPARLADLTAAAARLRSTLVVYWVGDGEIYAWTVAPDGAIHNAVTPLSDAKLLAMTRAVVPFQPAGGDSMPTFVTRGAQTVPIVVAPQPAWRELYDVLIQPIVQHLPSAPGARITIVPHGPLTGVPFAALRDRRGRYLVERYAVHATPAGALFDRLAADTRVRPGMGSALLVANPSALPLVSGEAPLAPLPGADDEVRAIATLWPRDRVTVLSGANATESRVLADTTRHSVIHLATHAVVRDANPAESFLALGRGVDDSATGELTPDKIYGLSLNADLVVLSACRSGGGPPTGDGIAALARAFISAGTPSLIASVWDVADAPTTRLLPAFYRAWLGGADKASALRTAQLRLIADLRAGRVTVPTRIGNIVLPEDPAFWAGFILIGEAD